MVSETTHRLVDGGALCGEPPTRVTPCDEAVTCATCLALLQLEAMRRRRMIQRSVVLIAKLASA